MGNIETAVTRWHRFAEQSSTPATPAAGHGIIYIKSDGRLYIKNDAGTESEAGGGLGVAQTAPTELTIASGAITVTQGFHKIDTEANAAEDNLDTINGGVTNALYLLRPEDAARVVIVRSGAGNIRTANGVSIRLEGLNDGLLLWYDGSTYNVINTLNNPKEMQLWGSYPDNSIGFAAQDLTSGDYSMVNGDEMQSWRTYQLSGAVSVDAVPNQHFVLDSATAFLTTINASTPQAGFAWTVQVLTAPGASTHDILLPSGVTWDGTNRRAIFNSTSDFLEGAFISSTRFLLKPTTTGVTYAAS